MEQIIVTSGVAGVITPWPGTGVLVKSVEFDIPMNLISTSTTSVNISGSSTGVTTLHSDVDLELKFKKGEDVNISGTALTATSNIVVKYLRYGEMNGYMALNVSGSAIPIPWHLR